MKFEYHTKEGWEMKYDIETLVDDLKDMFKNNFSAKITEINTEKGDSLLENPDTNAWFFQVINSKAFNYDPFVLYAVDPSLGESNSATSSDIVRISFEICITDDGENETDGYFRKLLRYTRAFKEIFDQYGRGLDSSVSMSLGSLSPLGVEIEGKAIKTAGVVIIASIAP